MAEEFTREIRVNAAYDHRDDPTNRRGCHGADLVLILRGPLGAITATISTGWLARPVVGPVVWGGPQRRRDGPGLDSQLADFYPSGSVVAAHSREPRDTSLSGHGRCPWLGDVPCYGDGSFTMADEVLAILVESGSDVAFERLEELYRSWIADRPVVPIGGQP